jgi:hypothetical protein
MSTADKELNLKPSDIIEEKHAKEQFETSYSQRIIAQRIIDDTKSIRENTIFNTDVKFKSTEQFKEHVECHAKWRHPITPYDCDCIHAELESIFNKYIYELYHSLATKKTWNKNIRAFIDFHKDTELTINTNELSDQEILEIKDQGFNFFVGDKCANIDEDEIDGPNDLAIDEWETIDEIIMYYYLKYTPEM